MIRTLIRPSSRRSLLKGLGAAGAAGVAISILPSKGFAAEEKKLNIYNWAEYDSPDTLKAFTAAKGQKLEVSNYASNEEMIAKLVASKGTGGYDIVVPTGSFIPQMAENGLLEKLNHAALPNLANVDPQRHFELGDAFHLFADFLRHLFDLSLGDFEDELVVDGEE